MSELINTRQHERDLHRCLLGTVSAAALLVSVSNAAASNDADRPTVWIELGGQLERVEGGQQAFAPPFFSLAATPEVLAPMVDAQKQPSHSFGENGKITFEPTGSNWLVSASIRYGRASSPRHLHYETARQTVTQTFLGAPQTGRDNEFGDGQGTTRESHLVVDFQAGKDVGLGLFGAKGTSVISAGVRFAQFTSGSDVTLYARPTYVSSVRTRPGKYTLHYHHFHSNTAVIQSRRSTRAIGPAVSWDASLPVVGDSASMAVVFDWGINAAILFGRQRAQTHHQTSGHYYKGMVGPKYQTNYANPPVDRNRSHSVTIPNVGGFAGVSFRYADAKVSFGYRGDFFFNAMDTGWDTKKSSTVAFYGPFASISIGLGG